MSNLESTTSDTINYEDAGLVELTIDELEYRVDAGKQGTALCVSTRQPGSWDWQFHGEVRFDGRELRSNSLDRKIRERLSVALREAAEGGVGS